MDNNETVVNQGNNTAETQAVRTFTQADVDSMVETRLARERAKYAAYGDLEELRKKAERLDQLEEGQKTELQKATERAASLQKELDGLKTANLLRETREKVAKETGVPADLLNGTTEEECKTQAQAILAFSNTNGYPSVRDAGELQQPVGKKSTRDQFDDWAKNLF